MPITKQKKYLSKGEKLKIISNEKEGWELSEVGVKPGVVLKHLHRASRSGFKGGALKLALKICDPRVEFIAVFDAMGCLSRYFISNWVYGMLGRFFPYGTFVVNILGAFIIGSIDAATLAVGLTGFWTQLIYGFMIVLSVIMHTYLRKRGE